MSSTVTWSKPRSANCRRADCTSASRVCCFLRSRRPGAAMAEGSHDGRRGTTCRVSCCAKRQLGSPSREVDGEGVRVVTGDRVDVAAETSGGRGEQRLESGLTHRQVLVIFAGLTLGM